MTTALSLCACGIPAEAEVRRCAVCPLASSAAGGSAAPGRAPADGQWVAGRFVPAQRVAPVYLESRWKKGPTTFGPMGRVVATLLLLIPVPFLVLTMAIGIGIAGMVAYCGFLLPMGLRHVWEKARIPLQ